MKELEFSQSTNTLTHLLFDGFIIHLYHHSYVYKLLLSAAIPTARLYLVHILVTTKNSLICMLR